MPSQHQGGQDEWVIKTLKEKRNGFFLDIGAGDPVENSNTHILRRDFGWTGIAVEPRIEEYQKYFLDTGCIEQVRPVHGCVINSDKAGHLVPFYFNVKVPEQSSLNSDSITSPLLYYVPAWGPKRLLKSFRAPAIIDYMSLDTEGNEAWILSTFPFHKYKVRCLTVEHNNVATRRDAIGATMASEGYVRVAGPSTCWWDDFYVKPELI